MEQIKKDKICHYCMTCGLQEREDFEGVTRCNNFIPDRENWEEEYRQAILEKGENNG